VLLLLFSGYITYYSEDGTVCIKKMVLRGYTINGVKIPDGFWVLNDIL
jgi:hypothetical protein